MPGPSRSRWRSELPPKVREGLRAVAMRVGLDVRRFHPAAAPSARRAHLLAAREIDLVVDAGASFGQYARLLRSAGYEGRIVSLEPLSAPFERLSARAKKDPRWRCYKLALGDESGMLPMNVAANSLSSSPLDPTELHQVNAPGSDIVGHEEVEVARLDDVAHDFTDSETRMFLKLDLQGYELTALRGGDGTLSRVDGIEAELSLAELYRGQPLLPEVIEYVGERGFRCVGLDPVMVDRSSGYLLQVDGLFVREIRTG